MRTDIDINKLKKQLEDELALVESDLKDVARKNPSNPADWEAVPGDMPIEMADENVLADKMEEFESNRAISTDLENRYNAIKKALEKIQNDTYGMCEISGEPIEIDRLEANPAATTCKAHMDQVG